MKKFDALCEEVREGKNRKRKRRMEEEERSTRLRITNYVACEAGEEEDEEKEEEKEVEAKEEEEKDDDVEDDDDDDHDDDADDDDDEDDDAEDDDKGGDGGVDDDDEDGDDDDAADDAHGDGDGKGAADGDDDDGESDDDDDADDDEDEAMSGVDGRLQKEAKHVSKDITIIPDEGCSLEEASNLVQTAVYDVLNEDPAQVRTGMQNNPVLDQPACSKRLRKKSRFVRTPYTNPRVCKSKIQSHNIFAITITAEEWDSLNTWIEEEDSEESTHVVLGLRNVHEVDRQFFRTLLTRDAWLDSDHMQAIVEELMLFAEKVIQSVCALYGPMFVCHLLGRSSDENSWSHDRYLRRLDWSGLEKVCLIVNVRSKHWILLELDLILLEARVYDSMATSRSVSDVSEVVKRIPALLRTVKCTEHQRSQSQWKAVLAKKVPQQNSGSGDCGVMVMAFVEHLLGSSPISPNCKHEHVQEFRNQFAVCLWRLSRELDV